MRGDRLVRLTDQVFVGKPGDFLRPHGRARLVFFEQGHCFLFERRCIPYYLAHRLDDPADGPGALQVEIVLIWASMSFAISIKTPSPSGDRRSSRRL